MKPAAAFTANTERLQKIKFMSSHRGRPYISSFNFLFRATCLFIFNMLENVLEPEIIHSVENNVEGSRSVEVTFQEEGAPSH